MRDLKVILIVTVFMLADMSALASASFDDDSLEDAIDERLPLRGERYAAEEYGWWLAYGPDANFDGMDDRLERVIAGEESVSTTAIIGADGRKTVAIVVDYAWHPGQEEIDDLVALLRSHGWSGDGSWFQVMDSIDSIVVDNVPVSALWAIHSLDSVVVVEMQNVMGSTLDIANPASRVRPSDVYSGTVYDRGYDGTGIVIAVLDSGVDNEHRSLNDFDDEDDEPDADPNSYDDQKWVAGYDATSQASNPDGSQDPDDGQGHGTHVAGIALGTGDSRGVHMGTAPGAYLVDVKVLTDTGGTNSQNSINGIQWMINNRDTNWGDGAKGIHIGQMSFGSIGNALDPNDSGDNGTGAESRLVNNATENGIACIVAAGNDGKNRIASPGSADGAITVGSADDDNSINRTNDFVASYSNWGPRETDNDDDEWDELKPDITAFGSGIMSASAATGSSFPGSPKQLADDGYESKDGTSMAAPLVSGVVALMLQAESSLTPEEIKDILRNSSEQRGSASQSDVSDRWNTKWGFGLMDGSCAVDMALERNCTPLEESGVIITPPPSNESELGVTISNPVNGTWFIVDEMVRIQGGIINGTGPWDRVDIKMTQHLNDGEEIVLVNWSEAGGTPNSWYLDVLIKDDWVNADESFVVFEVRASNLDDEVSVDARWGNIGRMVVAFGSPSSGSTIQGTVTFSGTAQGIEPSELHYRVGSEDWIVAHTFDDTDNGMQDWAFTWDSTDVSDGSHKISVKLVNLSGDESELVRRTFNVDNMPAAPALRFQGTVQIIEQDLPASTAVAGTILEIHFSVVNTGDDDATDLHVALDAPGSESTTYPSEGKIPRLEQGETRSVILWWWATEAGDHEVKIKIDPNELQNEVDVTDNEYSFTFNISERPVEPSLRFMTSAVTISPNFIPSPSTDLEKSIPYQINVRIDNLGQNAASNIKVTLYTWQGDKGFVANESRTLATIPGSSSSSGNAKATFTMTYYEVGTVLHRVLLEGDGVDTKHSEFRFNVVVDEYEIGSPTRLTLDEGESVLGFVGLPDGGLLFTTIDGELHARTVTDKFKMPGDTLIEDDWAGEFAYVARSDGRAHIAWTKRVESSGYTMTDIGMASIGVQGDIGGLASHMTPLKQSEGSYWGLDLDERNDEIVLAGYHRDIATGGSWMDITNVFILHNDNAKSNTGWQTKMNVLNDIDIRPQDGQAIAVALGKDQIHLLYQSMRDDKTGEDRAGLFYAHGKFTQTPFNFQAEAGDYASNPEMIEINHDGEDVLIAGWISKSGRSAEVMTTVQDSSWSKTSITNVSAPGATKIVFMEFDDGSVRSYHDEIGVYGPALRYGMYTPGDSIVGQSNLVGEGQVVGAGSIGIDAIVVMVSPSGQVNACKVVYLYPVEEREKSSFLDSILEPLPGDSRSDKLMVLSGIAVGLFMLFIVVVVVLRRSHSEEEEIEVVDKNELELLVVPEEDSKILVEIDTEAEAEIEVRTGQEIVIQDNPEERDLSADLEAKLESGSGSKRLERRMERKEKRETKERFEKMMEDLPLPPGPGELIIPLPQSIPQELDLPMPLPPVLSELDLGLPPLPNLEKTVVCPECNSSIIVKDMMLRKLDCPICSSIIEM
jgi:subtilisin family serine protease